MKQLNLKDKRRGLAGPKVDLLSTLFLSLGSGKLNAYEAIRLRDNTVSNK